MRKFIGSMGAIAIYHFASTCRPDKAFTPHPARRHCTLSLIHYRTFYDQFIMDRQTGLDAQQTNMDVIANNLANAVLTVLSVSARCLKICFIKPSPAGGTVFRTNHLTLRITNRTGVRPVATERLHSQGNLSQTTTAKMSRLKGRAFSR